MVPRMSPPAGTGFQGLFYKPCFVKVSGFVLQLLSQDRFFVLKPCFVNVSGFVLQLLLSGPILGTETLS
jgi:hypothetical protein